MRLSGRTIDASDPIRLAEFYTQLLGWDVVRQEGPRPGDPPEASEDRVAHEVARADDLLRSRPPFTSSRPRLLARIPVCVVSMGAAHTVLFTAEVVADAVQEVADAVDRDFDDGVVVLVVMKGAVIFAADLVRAMNTQSELAFITASSYEEGFTPGQSLTLRGNIDVDLQGRDVLIVDDIIDTGRTLRELAALVEARGARRVATAALVSKTQRRSSDSEADYYSLEITDEFIYGYGLDWDERYRDLPFIALAAP